MSAATFQYRAVDAAGAKRRGVLSASGEAEAFRKLTAMGLTPVALKPAASGIVARASVGRSKISARDLAHFTYQASVLVGSRIPLSEGLRSIAEQEREGPLKAVIADVAQRIEAGEPVAVALEAHAACFGEVYIQTIRAAEQSGNLTRALEHLSEMLERNQEMRRQVRGALMYPLCVVGVLVLSVGFLIGFVVPRFARMFQQRNVDLPAFTKALMLFGESIQHYWWAYLIGLAAAGLGLRHAWRTPRGRMVIDGALDRVPRLGEILSGLATARFVRILGVSVASGVGLIDSLELAGRAAGRGAVKRDAQRLAAHVRTGGRLAEVLPSCPSISGFTRRMLTAGEQSGELPRMCAVVSRHYERETSHLVKNISTLIEPVLIVAIAGVVLVVALAIFLPMWDMIKLVG